MNIELVGEFLGTMILVLLGNGVVAGGTLRNTKATGTGWIMITLGWGVAVALAVYASGFFSPAHLNPAVTIALAVVGDFDWGSVIGFIIAQILGAMVGQLLVYLHYGPHYLATTEDPDVILGTFSTAPAIRDTKSNIIGEMIGTAILVIVVMSMGPNQLTSGLGAIVVGLAVLGIGLSLGPTTGYAINPARDLGPRIMYQLLPIPNKRDADWSYGWIPVVGPILGGIIGAIIYDLILGWI